MREQGVPIVSETVLSLLERHAVFEADSVIRRKFVAIFIVGIGPRFRPNVPFVCRRAAERNRNAMVDFVVVTLRAVNPVFRKDVPNYSAPGGSAAIHSRSSRVAGSARDVRVARYDRTRSEVVVRAGCGGRRGNGCESGERERGEDIFHFGVKVPFVRACTSFMT